jgi:hypothetical protein
LCANTNRIAIAERPVERAHSMGARSRTDWPSNLSTIGDEPGGAVVPPHKSAGFAAL